MSGKLFFSWFAFALPLSLFLSHLLIGKSGRRVSWRCCGDVGKGGGGWAGWRGWERRVGIRLQCVGGGAAVHQLRGVGRSAGVIRDARGVRQGVGVNMPRDPWLLRSKYSRKLWALTTPLFSTPTKKSRRVLRGGGFERVFITSMVQNPCQNYLLWPHETPLRDTHPNIYESFVKCRCVRHWMCENINATKLTQEAEKKRMKEKRREILALGASIGRQWRF